MEKKTNYASPDCEEILISPGSCILSGSSEMEEGGEVV
jgi:hypothetical protein